jgi:hypothetical protein
LGPRVDSDVLEKRKTLTPAGNQRTFPRLSSQGPHTVETTFFQNIDAKKTIKHAFISTSYTYSLAAD